MKKLKKIDADINKQDFINLLIVKTNLSRTQVEKGLEEILIFFEECFEMNCLIEIRGFGKWKCKQGKVKFFSYVNFDSESIFDSKNLIA